MKSLFCTTAFGFGRRLSIAGVVLIAVLIATASAEASGFNVNSEVTFAPLTSTYRTTNSGMGCPAGFAGKFTFTAQLTNKTGSPAMPGVTVRVLTLTNGNVLLDPQTNTVLGGEGAFMQAPKVGQYADGLLSAGESVNVPFIVCLKTLQPFQFFVDVFGIVTKLVSINRTGTDSGNQDSALSSLAINANGRFVAFISRATDLVSLSTAGGHGGDDVFVRDLQTGTTALASRNRFGADNDLTAFGSLTPPAISADGRFVAFTSAESDLVANDTNGEDDVFVRDLNTGTTRLVSVNRTGTDSGKCSPLSIPCRTMGPESTLDGMSGDGRFAMFSSYASDLVATDTNADGGSDHNAFRQSDVFVRDLQMGTTTLVSVNLLGTDSGNGGSTGPGTSGETRQTISANGRFAAFLSEASDLVANDTNGTTDVFVRDLQTGTTTLVSMNRFGTHSGNGSSPYKVISADGRSVAFLSDASDLVANDTNGTTDVFVRDLQTGTTTLVSMNRFGTGSGNGLSSGMLATSANGRFVAFSSEASDLVAVGTNGGLFVRDLQTGTTTLVSVNRTGTGSTSSNPVISADGRFVAFLSGASDLVATDTNGVSDVFVRDLQTGTTTLMSVNRTGMDSGNANPQPHFDSGSFGPVISADGRFVAFWSTSNDLVTTDTNNMRDVFVRPVP